MTVREQLEHVIADFEAKAAAVRGVLDLLGPAADVAVVSGPAAVPANGNGNGNGTRASAAPAVRRGRPAKDAAPYVSQRVAQRTRTAQFLAAFSADDPTPAPSGNTPIGILIARGYLKRRGGGYVRTAKPFTVE